MSDYPKDPWLNKLPPHSIEAEESLLSAVLIDNSILIDIVEILEPEDFYKTAHQKIFSGVIKLFSKSEPVDLVTLANHLKESGQLEEVGGAVYLANLIDTVPMAVNAEYYAGIIRDKSLLRRLIENSNTVVRRCFEDRGDVDDVIDYAEKSIFELSENKIKKSFHAIGSLVNKSIDSLEERQGNNDIFTGVPTGFSRFDLLTAGLQKSDLIILAARPAMGKTSFALNIARNAAVDSNVPVAVFSLEMSKEQLSMRLLTSEARIDASRLRGGFFSSEDWERLTHAAGVLEQAPLYIDDSADLKPTDILAKTRRLKADKGLGLVIIDYLQLMRGKENSERRDIEISGISRFLKMLAKEVDVPVIALSQLNRMLEQRKDKRPMLSDLRESGSIEQDADVVAFIYRDEVYNPEQGELNRGKAEIIIGKQRNGPTGVVNLAFLKAYTRFEDLAHDHYST